MTAPGGYPTDPMGRMGEPPSGPLDYVIVLIALITVIISTVLTVRALIHPGEQARNHIKRVILDDDAL